MQDLIQNHEIRNYILNKYEIAKESDVNTTINYNSKIYHILKKKDTNEFNVSIDLNCHIKYYIEPIIYEKTKEEIISNRELKSKILSLTDSLNKSISLVVNGKIMDINEIIEKAKFSGFSFNLFDAKIIIDENYFNNYNKMESFESLNGFKLTPYFKTYFSEVKEEPNNFKIICSEERKQFIEKIKYKILLDEEKSIYIFGPFGIGKSITLLAFLKTNNIRGCYFNLKIIFKSHFYKDILLNESCRLFDSYLEYEKFLDIESIKNFDSKKNNPFDLIKIIINNLPKSENERYVFLDQFKDHFEDSDLIISNEIDRFIKNVNLKNIVFIKVCSMNNEFVKETFYNSFFKNSPYYIYIEHLLNVSELDDSKEDESKYFGDNLYLYHLYKASNSSFENFLENEINIFKDEIKKLFNNDTLEILNSISSITNAIKNPDCFTKYEAQNQIKILPMKYLKLIEIIENENENEIEEPEVEEEEFEENVSQKSKENEEEESKEEINFAKNKEKNDEFGLEMDETKDQDNKQENRQKVDDTMLKDIKSDNYLIKNQKKYNIKYSNLLIQISFEKLVLEELNKIKESNIMKEIKSCYGNLFEIIVHEQLICGKLSNMKLSPKQNFFINGSIYLTNEINYKEDKKNKKNIMEYNSVYLRPSISNSESYDSLFLIKNKNNKYNGCLFQMTIRRKKSKILTRKEHHRKIHKIKDKIKKVYEIDIENMHVKYIFKDLTTNEKEVNECKMKCVDYLFLGYDLQFYIEENGKMNKIDNIDFNDLSLISNNFYDLNGIIKSKKKKNAINNKAIFLLNKKRNRINDLSSLCNEDFKDKSKFGIKFEKLEDLFPEYKLVISQRYNSNNREYIFQYLYEFKIERSIFLFKYLNNIFALNSKRLFVYKKEETKFIEINPKNEKKEGINKNDVLVQFWNGEIKSNIEIIAMLKK